jgi:DNA-binding PucR family transcriptional regulator
VILPPVADDGTALEHLVDVLGPSVLRVLTSPGLDRGVVRDVVIYDVAEAPTLRPGDVLLGVGLVATSDNACRVVAEAGSAGAAAVVVRSREADLPHLRRAATDSGVTLIVLPAAMRWEQISVLMRNALAVKPSDSRSDTMTGDLFGFADALAAGVGGAVTIEDASSHVLAYSTPHEEDLDPPRREAILGRRVPEAYLQHLKQGGVFDALETSDEVVRVDANAELGLRHRLVVAVRVNGELLGTIWVQEGRVSLGAEAEAALAQAARNAPGHLIRAHSTGLTMRQRREDSLRALLTADADATTAAEALGFDAELPCALLGVALDSPGRLGTDHRAFRRVDELLRARAMAFRWLVASTLSGGRLLVLVPELTGRRDRVEAAIERLSTGLCQDAERAGVAVRIACGPWVPRLADVAATTATVDQILQLLARDPSRNRVASHASARAAVAVSHAMAALAPVSELQQGAVATLLHHDLRHGTEYRATLAAWLESFGDNALAARSLNIHPNTVRYRLQRIVEVSGIRLEDPDERLVAMLHLRLTAGAHRLVPRITP